MQRAANEELPLSRDSRAYDEFRMLDLFGVSATKWCLVYTTPRETPMSFAHLFAAFIGGAGSPVSNYNKYVRYLKY